MSLLVFCGTAEGQLLEQVGQPHRFLEPTPARLPLIHLHFQGLTMHQEGV